MPTELSTALGTAGFVVADVRTLDRQQGSHRQVTSSAVEKNLIVDVAATLPDPVVQEDAKLLMYVDVAQMRLGGDP